jgi:hypothetical protein
MPETTDSTESYTAYAIFFLKKYLW